MPRPDDIEEATRRRLESAAEQEEERREKEAQRGGWRSECCQAPIARGKQGQLICMVCGEWVN
jgi:hypothetical protein